MAIDEAIKPTRRSFLGQLAALGAAAPLALAGRSESPPLPGTEPLTESGDLAAKMVAGIDKYLDRELAAAPERRQALWKPDFSSPEAYSKTLEPHRGRLRKIIGAVDERIKPVTMKLITGEPPALAGGVPPGPIAKGDGYSVYAVRWPVFEGVHGEGLLLQPDKEPIARVVALPDCDWTPEMLVGMAPGLPPESQFARRLAENGCQVIVPVLIDRKDTWSGNAKIGKMTNQPHREFIYRMAYQMGRHIIGYEVQKVLAVVDWFAGQKEEAPIGLFGHVEGGMLALYAAALDPRVRAAGARGYFGPREGIWQEPIYRNVWGLLTEFGDGNLVRLVVPRTLLVGSVNGPEVDGPPPARDGRSGAAPGKVLPPTVKQAEQEVERIREMGIPKLGRHPHLIRELGIGAAVLNQKEGLLEDFFTILTGVDRFKPREDSKPPVAIGKSLDPAVRLKRQFDQLVEYTQKLVRPHAEVRRQEFFWDKVNVAKLGGLTPAARLKEYQKSCEPLRKYFWEEVIGKLPEPTMPPNPRTAALHDTPRWKSYDVVLDVYPDVIAQGILAVPKGMKNDERRPVVVCQHGLEGRPRDVVNPKEQTKYYNSFGSALADRGFVVFAPQNPYIFGNTFRQLQRKANPLKLSLFSFIVRQHERILDWLATLPFVDAKRIAFYGLSYGGKTAMRVPAILDRYCLSICSADFNEWIWKNTSVDYRGSYMFTGEYEMPEFDLGNTFNYAEMAGLIAPRPFMVERGHDDGVGIDEWVAYEYAKVRRLYAKLGTPERSAIEFFNGGHEINGQGTFAFLHKHLNWPEPPEARRGG